MTVRIHLGIFSIITSLIIGSPIFGMEDLNDLLSTMNQHFKISQPKSSQRPLTPAEEQEFKAREDSLTKDIEVLNAIKQSNSTPIQNFIWYHDEYNDYIKKHRLSIQERRSFWKFIQDAQLWADKTTPFNDLVDAFNQRHESNKSLSPFNQNKSEPNPEPSHTKKYIIITIAGISIPIAVGFGFGICKAMPYIREKIKEWKEKATTKVSANVVPASIATTDQMPSLATIHQS